MTEKRFNFASFSWGAYMPPDPPSGIDSLASYIWYMDGHSLACEQAHIWEHRHERQRANSKARRSGGEESGEEALRKSISSRLRRSRDSRGLAAHARARIARAQYSLFVARACVPKYEPARRLATHRMLAKTLVHCPGFKGN